MKKQQKRQQVLKRHLWQLLNPRLHLEGGDLRGKGGNNCKHETEDEDGSEDDVDIELDDDIDDVDIELEDNNDDVDNQLVDDNDDVDNDLVDDNDDVDQNTN